MTSFKITNDDSAIRSLKATPKTAVTASSAVTPVKASNPVQASPENLPLKTTPVDKRSNGAANIPRKQTDRRKNDAAVLLDTRTQQDRRKKKGNKNDVNASQNETTSRSIDEMV